MNCTDIEKEFELELICRNAMIGYSESETIVLNYVQH